MVFLGIDPGASGGLVALRDDCVRFTPMPKTELDIWQWFKEQAMSSSGIFGTIEQVSGYIGEAQPGSAAFKFGMSYGGLRMALVAAGIPFTAVRPQEWQKALGIEHRKKSESKSDWKNRLKREAELRFPRLKVTLAVADALLIASFCKEIHAND